MTTEFIPSTEIPSHRGPSKAAHSHQTSLSIKGEVAAQPERHLDSKETQTDVPAFAKSDNSAPSLSSCHSCCHSCCDRTKAASSARLQMGDRPPSSKKAMKSHHPGKEEEEETEERGASFTRSRRKASRSPSQKRGQESGLQDGTDAFILSFPQQSDLVGLAGD